MRFTVGLSFAVLDEHWLNVSPRAHGERGLGEDLLIYMSSGAVERRGSQRLIFSTTSTRMTGARGPYESLRREGSQADICETLLYERNDEQLCSKLISYNSASLGIKLYHWEIMEYCG